MKAPLNQLHCISQKLDVVRQSLKSRENLNEIAFMKLMGNVEGKVVAMVDDIIDTAGTITRGSDLLLKNGAKEVYILACHGLFSGNALEKINNSNIKKIVVSNSIPQNENITNHDLIDIIDISYLCSEAIRRQNNGESLHELYKVDKSTSYEIVKIN